MTDRLLPLTTVDKTLAVVTLISSIIIRVIGSVIGRLTFLLVGSLVAISCLLWLAIRRSHNFEDPQTSSRTKTIVSSIIFFGLFTLSIISIYLRPELYGRPPLFFFLTGIMAGTIACEILTSNRRNICFILIQIILLGVIIAWSQLLLFPSLLGIDPWYHYAFTNVIIDEGFIPEGNSYSKLPLFHLMVAATSLLLDISYKFAAMLSVSIGQIVCNAIFIFLITNYLFKNHRIGLLASLMVILAEYPIRMSIHSIPNGFAVILIPIIIYMILKNIHRKSPNPNIILVFLLMVTVVLTHSIAAMSLSLTLFIAWIASVYYRTFHPRVGNHISLSLPLFFTVLMLTWWAYSSGHISTLSRLIEWGFSIDVFRNVTPTWYQHYAITVPLGEQIISKLPTFSFFAASLVGLFYMVSRKGNYSTSMVASIGIAPLALIFLTNVTGTTVIEGRWCYLAQILLSIPLGLAVYLVATWRPRKIQFRYISIFFFVTALCFLTTMGSLANDHVFTPVTGITYAYTQSEMVASGFVAKYSIDVISSDRNFCTNPSSSVFSNVYGFETERLHSLDDSIISGKFDNDGSLKILRHNLLNEPISRGGLYLPVRSDLVNHISSLEFNKIYANPGATSYIG